jgi:predicted Holliday junction resolvase-like endonuclease
MAADTVIKQLVAISGLRIECPRCDEEFSIGKARLFGMYDAYPPIAQQILGERTDSADRLRAELRMRRAQLAKSKEKEPEKITVSAQASHYGQISEQILPAFLTFPYKQSDCRILLKPIDYIVFTKLSDARIVEAIKFVDVKTGNGRLSQGQRQIRDCVSEGKIKHRVVGG